jgi:hypothetical protein
VKLDDRLRQADERLVPRLAAGLRRFVDTSAARRERWGSSVRRTTERVVAPSDDSVFRRLDDRFAARGPLALLRDIPQLGLLLVAAVFFTASGIALERSGNAQHSVDARAQVDATIPTTLGPPPGTKVAAYLAATRKRAVVVSSVGPDDPYVALVSFSSYLTADQAAVLLGRLEVSKVLAHVQLANAEVLTVPVTTTLVQDVGVTFRAIAQRKVKDREEFLKLATSITGTSKDETQFKAFYTEAARTAGKEAAAYRQTCSCLFAALVHGRARDLAALPSIPGVRAVDIGGHSDDTVQLQPLLPEQKVTVTRPVTPVQGNGA